MDHEVLDVEVTNRNLVGIAVGDDQGLCDSPLPYAREGSEYLLCIFRRCVCETIDDRGPTRHLPQNVGTALLELHLVEDPVRGCCDRAWIWRQAKVGMRARCGLGESGVQAPNGRGRFPARHLLGTHCDDKCVEHLPGATEPKSRLPAMQLADKRMVRLELGWIVFEP